MIPPTSRRTAIVESFFQLIKKVGDGSIELPSGEFLLWRYAAKEPLFKVPDITKLPSMNVFDFQERVLTQSDPLPHLVDARLFLVLEVVVAHALEGDASTEIDAVIWPIQKVVALTGLRDPEGRHLCKNLKEVGSKTKIESNTQRIVSCEMAWSVDYSRKAVERPV